MCPICHEEKKNHENHRVVNYERYINLFEFFQKNFTFIKETIAEKEQMIKGSNKLYSILEQQKQAYINFLESLSKDIKKIYSQNQEKINQGIAKSMQIIAKLRNFMLNTKKHVSKQFKNGYNDIDNLEEIKEEIKKRIEKLKIKELKNENFNLKDFNTMNLEGIIKKNFIIRVNKNDLLKNQNLVYKCENANYSFGILKNEKDPEIITLYLDINKIINNKPNYSSYIAQVEFYNKKYYLLPYEINAKLYSFEKTIPIKELFGDKAINSSINLTFFTLSLK